MENTRQYYIDRIIDCAANNNLYDYTIIRLHEMDTNELIATWDGLRLAYGNIKGIKQ